MSDTDKDGTDDYVHFDLTTPPPDGDTVEETLRRWKNYAAMLLTCIEARD